MFIRNKLFDFYLLPSKSFDIPVISVGNLSVGGTGKTPMVEYLVRLLKDDLQVATLSRGYGRKTSGFILAPHDGTVTETDIGDEPLQYLRKFDDVIVAVDERRAKGVSRILKRRPDTGAVLLDDAFQHRYIKPGLSILLTDFYQLYCNDYVMPTGTLREFRSGANRANIIVVTKTPRTFSPLLQRELEEILNPKPHQRLFYSYLDYDDPVPFTMAGEIPPVKSKYSHILLVTGIANPYPLQDRLSHCSHELNLMEFPDHHAYTEKDVLKITAEFNSIFAKDKVIFTTEKDAMRMDKPEYKDLLEGIPIYYIPIQAKMHNCNNDARFDKRVKAYVRKNSGNGRIYKKQASQ